MSGFNSDSRTGQATETHLYKDSDPLSHMNKGIIGVLIVSLCFVIGSGVLLYFGVFYEGDLEDRDMQSKTSKEKMCDDVGTSLKENSLDILEENGVEESTDMAVVEEESLVGSACLEK